MSQTQLVKTITLPHSLLWTIPRISGLVSGHNPIIPLCRKNKRPHNDQFKQGIIGVEVKAEGNGRLLFEISWCVS